MQITSFLWAINHEDNNLYASSAKALKTKLSSRLKNGSVAMFLQYDDESVNFQPNASLGFSIDNLFLVLKVAVIQQPGRALRKIQDYILGSHQQIAFMVLIIVER